MISKSFGDGAQTTPIRVVRRPGPQAIAKEPNCVPPCTVLVMAANRRSQNPLAHTFGVSHKCSIPIAGVPMLEWVLRTLKSLSWVNKILISAETRDILHRIPYIDGLIAAGLVSFVPSGGNLSQSVLKAASLLDDTDYPLLVTTGDNVLHTAEIIGTFYALTLSSGVDAAFALTPRSVVEAAYPAEAPGLGYLDFASESHSNCNIYFLRSRQAVRAAEVMKDGGQFRSHPWRIIRAVGLGTLVLYKLGRLSLPVLCARLERVFQVSVGIVILPYADAPIDADTPEALVLIERILRIRQGDRHAA